MPALDRAELPESYHNLPKGCTQSVECKHHRNRQPMARRPRDV